MLYGMACPLTGELTSVTCIWFRAIRLFAVRTSITAAELAIAIGIHHQATGRQIIPCMRSARPADDVCDRFAGLGSLTK